MSRCAVITGVTGQDGAYLARLLLDKGYRVIGLSERQAPDSPSEALAWVGAHDVERLRVELTDIQALRDVLRTFRPDEVYNLAAVSDLKTSWDQPFETGRLNGMAVLTLLEAIRLEAPDARFCQASSAEMLGKGRGAIAAVDIGAWPEPTSPYTTGKLFGHWMIGHYRQAFGQFACSAVLFNHESPLRSTAFVTRKVTDAVARISLGLQTELRLHNLEARRDWGHARDTVRALWLMLQHETPDDYVVATGQTHSIGDLVQAAFDHVGLDPADHVVTDGGGPMPAEEARPVGDASKARAVLGWAPETGFQAMVREMVDADLARPRLRDV